MYDLIVIGSGLSSFAFLKGLKTVKKKICIISYESQSTKIKTETENIDYKNLPPRLELNNKNKKNILNFYKKNNFKINSQTSIFGVVSHGGVSDYWGCSNEDFNVNKINFLNKKNKNFLKKANIFFNNRYYSSDLKKNRILNNKNQKNYVDLKNKLLNFKSKLFKFYNNTTAYNEKKKIEFRPANYFKEINKKIKLYNYFVDKIRKRKKYYEIYCNGKKGKKIFRARKLVLAAGTFSTTRIVCEMLKFKNKIKVFHNPMLFGVFISRYLIQNKESRMPPSDFALKINDKLTNSSLIANFRRINTIIEKKIFQNFRQANNYLFRKIFNIFKFKLIFTNLYLSNKFSNIFFKYDDKEFKIYSDYKKTKINNKLLKRNFQKIYKYLKLKNLITFLHYSYVPETGSDSHFIGTIPISKKKSRLSLNENCELKNFKNLFIVDGSSIPKNNLKFPTNLIICNAYRIGRLIK
jgi:hypothetical protein